MIQYIKAISPKGWFYSVGLTAGYFFLLMVFLKQIYRFQNKVLFAALLILLLSLMVFMDNLITGKKISNFEVMLYYPFLFYAFQFTINFFTHVQDDYTLPFVISLFIILPQTIKQKEAPDTLGWPKTLILFIY